VADKIRDFKQLQIWQKGMDIVREIYRLTGDYPKSEVYGLASQMRRSAVSIPSNIAEGFRRRHEKEYRQFLYISLGSGAELETQVLISKDLEYISEGNVEQLSESLDHLSRMTRALIRKLK
jgi:four helix bundle protein